MFRLGLYGGVLCRATIVFLLVGPANKLAG